MRNYPELFNFYIEGVKNGSILACKWIKLAIARHENDLKVRSEEFYFDEKAGAKVCKFIEAFPHTKGKWARKGEKITLEPWQVWFVMSVFGWKRTKDDRRRFRRAFLLVPRKNGKSLLAAPIGLYMLSADGEYGSEVYSGATSEKQAWEVFRPAKIMAQRVPEFLEYFGVEVNASNINIADNGSRFEPVIGKPGDGSSPHCAIVDEVHEHKTDDLIDTMETGMGAREQPLLLAISTAGDNLAGPCYQMQKDAEKMLEGMISDDITFAAIYTIDEGDDWTSVDALKKANPNYGVSVDDDFLLARLQEAKQQSRKQGVFKTKHLNIWVGARSAYFNMQKWHECANTELKEESYAGRLAYIGLDLSSKVDIAALEILIPESDGRYTRFSRYYLPEETVMSGGNDHYKAWMKDGRITVTEGAVIDYRRIYDDILDISKFYDVKELAYDPFQATMLVNELMAANLPVVEMRPTVLNFSEPMKTLEALIRSNKIQHDGCPVMAWMMSNVVASEDAKDNVYPRKERPEAKIDGPVALIMALGRALVHKDDNFGAAIDDMLVFEVN